MPITCIFPRNKKTYPTPSQRLKVLSLKIIVVVSTIEQMKKQKEAEVTEKIVAAETQVCLVLRSQTDYS